MSFHRAQKGQWRIAKPFADRILAHRLEGARGAAGQAGYTRFEIARAILHFAVEEMMLVGRDPNVLDAVLEEANSLAILVEPPRVE